MKEDKIYNEITNIIETVEVNTRVRQFQNNSEKLKAYWEIGKLIVEAQGGLKNTKYGNNLINNWSINLSKKNMEYFIRKLIYTI